MLKIHLYANSRAAGVRRSRFVTRHSDLIGYAVGQYKSAYAESIMRTGVHGAIRIIVHSRRFLLAYL